MRLPGEAVSTGELGDEEEVGGEAGLGAGPGGLGLLAGSSKMGVETRVIGTAAVDDKQAPRD